MPTHHRNEIATSSAVIIAAIGRGLNVGPLVHAFLEGHWRDDADLADRATLVRLADNVGFEGDALMLESAAPEVAAQYEANTQEAIARSVFGSPTYFVDGDMFYGQDRLALVERALDKAYAGEPRIDS